jgi:hypothetical protein
MNHRSVNRTTAPISLRHSSRPEATPLKDSNLAQRTETKQPFVEDFNMEHCCSGITAALMAFSANTDSASGNSHAQLRTPPTCVYLG